MKIRSATVIASLALVAASFPALADESKGVSPEARKQWCKDNPEQCHEAMQRKAESWWKRVDTDGDGTVSRAEAEANAPRLARDFDKIDVDGDGKITREELEGRGKAGMEQRRKEWWAKVDADHDGSIDKQEAAANAPRLARDFDKMDANGDGKITAEELQAARKK